MEGNVIHAPDTPKNFPRPSIFLAGTTTPLPDGENWRENLINRLANSKITFLDPTRKDWDDTWKEDASDQRWAGQVDWEMKMRETADIVAVFFHGSTLAPISLLELGLSAKSGNVIVCAMPGYQKRGYVEAVCKLHKCTFVTSEEELVSAVKEKFGPHYELWMRERDDKVKMSDLVDFFPGYP